MKFLKEHAIEPNSKMTYAQLLHRHIYPYIGKRRVAEISREALDLREALTGCASR